jgi:hypothetical protein
LRVALFNKGLESYALWCFMLSTSCFAFNASHSNGKEGSNSYRVGRRIRIETEEACRSSVARDSPRYRGVAAEILKPPFVQYIKSTAGMRNHLHTGMT